MSENGPGELLKEWNEDFESLVAIQTDWREYTVLNAANEPPTAYNVDVKEIDCTCEYMTQGPSGEGICKHLAKAILVSPTRFEADAIAAHDIQLASHRAMEAAEDLMNVRDVATAAQNANAAAQATGGGEDASGSDLSPEDRVKEWLKSNNAYAEGMSLEYKDQFGSVNIDTQNELSDEQFQNYRDLKDSTDGFFYHNSEQIDVVKADLLEDL